MKLYTLTEEQVEKVYKDGNLDGFNHVNGFDTCIKSLTPIELPSDEEIAKDLRNEEMNSYAAFEGAIWMKEKILNQNK